MSRLRKTAKLARRLRPVAAARSMGSPASLKRNGAAYRRLGLRKAPFASVSHAEVSGRGGGSPWLDSDPGEAEIKAAQGFSELPEVAQSAVCDWPENGYLKLPAFFPPERIDAANSELDELTRSGQLRTHARAPRVMNAYKKSPAVADLVSDPGLRRILDFLLGRRAQLFQTISFTHGSQQKAHSDAFHMMTEPPGYLVGVWVALEDVDEGSGPVFYLPGSHRLPYAMTEDLEGVGHSSLFVAEKGPAYLAKMEEVVRGSGTDPVAFTANKGDVLVWHHNLLHGGQGIARPGATRRSLVGHFFGEDVLCYHEVTERPALMP